MDNIIKANLKRIKRHSLTFTFYFFYLAVTGIFLVHNLHSNLFCNIESFLALPSGLDSHSFATGALDLYHHGNFSPENRWLIRLWPPGLMALEAAILAVFGKNVPFILILMILNTCLVALTLVILNLNFRYFIPKRTTYLLPIVIFLFFPLHHLFFIDSQMVILGEGFASSFFISAMFLLPIAIQKKSYSIAMIAGTLLGCSSYFRPQFEIIVLFQTIYAIIGLLCYVVIRLRYKQIQQHIHFSFRVILLTLICAHLIMLPWRLHNFVKENTISWVLTSTLVYQHAALTDKQLQEVGDKFFRKGGGNLACQIDPTYCGSGGQAAFYRVFFTHTREWLFKKFKILYAYWFSTNAISDSNTTANLLENFFNVFALFCIVITLPLLLAIKKHPFFIIFSWMCASFYSCFLTIYTLVHIEFRYFFIVKLFSIFSAAILSIIAWHCYKKNKKPFKSKNVEVTNVEVTVEVTNDLSFNNNTKILLSKKNRQSSMQAPVIYNAQASEWETLDEISSSEPDLHVVLFSKITAIGRTLGILNKKVFYHPELVQHCSSHDSKGGAIYTYKNTDRGISNVQLNCKKPISISGYCLHLLKEHSPNYYHWLFECMPRLIYCILYLKNNNLLRKNLTILVDRGVPSQGIELLKIYMERFHVPYRIFFVDAGQFILCKHLYYVTPFWYALDNTSRKPHVTRDFFVDSYAVSLIQKLFDHDSNNTPSKYIYLARNHSTYRKMINAEEVEKLLTNFGFEIINPHLLSFREQLELFSTAKLIAGPAGAAFSNIIFMQKKTTALIFSPSTPSTNYYVFQQLADSAHVKLVHFLTSPASTDNNSVHADFHVDCRQLTHIINELGGNYAPKKLATF